jgi:putative membrane protein
MRIKRVIPLGAAMLFVAAVAFAQMGRDVAMMSGQQFARQLAQGGLAEVSLGQIAQDRAYHPRVRRFADHMVSDHSRANDELMDLAQRKGWRLPSQPDPNHRALERRVSRLRGAAFDRAYMRAMVSDHDQTVAMVRTYSRHGRDPDLRAFARRTLPTLMEHQRMARNTAQAI